MKFPLLAAIMSALLAAAHAATCAECFATYEVDKGSTEDNAIKCTALKNVVTCLTDAASCTLTAAQGAAIEADLDAMQLEDDCYLSKTCNCQKDYWEKDQTGGDAAVCTEAILYYDCLDGKTELACDGTSSATDLMLIAQDRIDGITSCNHAQFPCLSCF